MTRFGEFPSTSINMAHGVEVRVPFVDFALLERGKPHSMLEAALRQLDAISVRSS